MIAARIVLGLGIVIAGCADSSHPLKDRDVQDSGGEHQLHWSYGQDGGPEQWATLSPDFTLCAEGQTQSPIDLTDVTPEDRAAPGRAHQPASLRIAHQRHVVDVIDNGHTIQVTYDAGSTLEVDGATYELLQYHFHAPSEHTIHGKHLPMEMHLVHQAASGQLAVVGVLIEEGSHNAMFDPVWENLPRTPGESRHLENIVVDIDALLPEETGYFRYDGSLTTPPCSEGVKWLVMSTPMVLSNQQIQAFESIFRDNHRPIQSLNGRPVTLIGAMNDLSEAPPGVEE